MKHTDIIKNVNRRIRAEKLKISSEDASKVIEFYLDEMADTLIKGEDFQMMNVGRLFSKIITGKNNLHGTEDEYSTVKFKFTPYQKIKSYVKEKIHLLTKEKI